MSPFGCAKGGGGGGTTGGSTGNPSGGSSGNPTGGSSGNPTGGTNRSGGTSGNPSGGSSGNPTGGTSSNPSGGTSSNPSGGSSGNPTGGTSGNPTGGSSGNPTGGTSGNPTGGTSGNPTGGTSGNPTGGTSRSGGTSSSGGTVTTSGGIGNSGGTVTTSGGIGSTGGTTSSGGATGGSNTSACPAGPDVISDFESGKGDMIKQGTPQRTGYWYTYFPGSDTASAPASGMSQIPALSNGNPIAVASDSTNGTCSKYALHTTGSGFGTAPNNYAGVGANFTPHVPYDKISTAYDVSGYTGISFKIKSGGTTPAVFFEMLTKDNQPATAGGVATNQKIDLYNTRGQMLNDPWTPGGITSAWQTITVPFGTLIPRWVPDSTGCTGSTGGGKCQAKPFVPANTLGIQISMYQDPGFPKVGTAGTYDLWIDDVQFVKGDAGLQTRTGFPPANAGSMGSCLTPQGPNASAKFLVPAYNLWKKTFASGGKVIRPENGNDTVSEGIAYAMMISVAMNDQTLFDSMYSYWKGHIASGTLMTWCIPAGGASCTASGGSATDADEDAAYALLRAGTAWGGSYKADAMTMIADIWSKDIDATTKLPKGGSNYQSPTGSGGLQITNASYFAPSFYTAFKAAGDGNDWASVNTAVYKAINSISGSNGLIPAWCGSSCTVAADNGAAGGTDMDYQYDSHRIPMRIGMDYCFNGTADAKSYTTKNTAFFVGAAANGIGYVLDMYTPSGGTVSGTAPNSASILGTAAVGAMASGNQTFLNDAYQAVFDGITRGTMAPVDAAGKTPYSYYNATVGLLTALIMTGAFPH
jgi:endo-1,4-beta-D-glucanase Y